MQALLYYLKLELIVKKEKDENVNDIFYIIFLINCIH